MSAKTRTPGPPVAVIPTEEQLYSAAVRLFAERGYHGTSLREIVDAVGVQIATFYYYFDSKQGLLRRIMEKALGDLSEEVFAAVEAEEGVVARLQAGLRAHIHFHALRPAEAFIADSELRALEPEGRERIVAMRDAHEEIFHRIIESGRKGGVLRVVDVKVETYALMSLATAVAGWYQSSARLSVDQIADIYCDLVLEGLRHRKAG